MLLLDDTTDEGGRLAKTLYEFAWHNMPCNLIDIIDSKSQMHEGLIKAGRAKHGTVMLVTDRFETSALATAWPINTVTTSPLVKAKERTMRLPE